MAEKESVSTLFLNSINNVLDEELANADTKEEKERILSKFEAIDIESLFIKFMNDIQADTFSYMKKTMYEEVMRFRANDQEFLARQEQKWYKAFVASESMYIMTIEAAEVYSEYVKTLSEEEFKSKYWTYTALKYIHGRALQQYLEIITLMKNGFADGAFARWRSMYELSIMCSFIKMFGEKTAQKFCEASVTDDRYEWARESQIFSTKKKYITFNDIQKECDLSSDAWKQQYDLANIMVHASPQGTFYRLCDMGTKEVIPVGRSDYGITTPGEHSAISLAQISAMFFTIFPESDTLVQANNINNWIDVVREAYFKTHDEVFPDDEPLWDNGITQKI